MAEAPLRGTDAIKYIEANLTSLPEAARASYNALKSEAATYFTNNKLELTPVIGEDGQPVKGEDGNPLVSFNLDKFGKYMQGQIIPQGKKEDEVVLSDDLKAKLNAAKGLQAGTTTEQSLLTKENGIMAAILGIIAWAVSGSPLIAGIVGLGGAALASIMGFNPLGNGKEEVATQAPTGRGRSPAADVAAGNDQGISADTPAKDKPKPLVKTIDGSIFDRMRSATPNGWTIEQRAADPTQTNSVQQLVFTNQELQGRQQELAFHITQSSEVIYELRKAGGKEKGVSTLPLGTIDLNNPEANLGELLNQAMIQFENKVEFSLDKNPAIKARSENTGPKHSDQAEAKNPLGFTAKEKDRDGKPQRLGTDYISQPVNLTISRDGLEQSVPVIFQLKHKLNNGGTHDSMLLSGISYDGGKTFTSLARDDGYMPQIGTLKGNRMSENPNLSIPLKGMVDTLGMDDIKNKIIKSVPTASPLALGPIEVSIEDLGGFAAAGPAKAVDRTLKPRNEQTTEL